MNPTILLTDSEYLTFVEHHPADRKTPIVMIYAKKSGDLLGSISWYGRWRQFTFHPKSDTIWNFGCLSDVQRQIKRLMDLRKTST